MICSLILHGYRQQITLRNKTTSENIFQRPEKQMFKQLLFLYFTQ